jgi:type VI secretion system protein ImpH
VLLGMTARLNADTANQQRITVNLGRYQGLHRNPCQRETQHVAYRF